MGQTFAEATLIKFSVFEEWWRDLKYKKDNMATLTKNKSHSAARSIHSMSDKSSVYKQILNMTSHLAAEKH